jgi:hypothetical protein
MLSFEVLEGGKIIQIYCDSDGMATLVETLESLVRQSGHKHLRGPSAGGQALSETTPFGDPAVGEVIIDFNPNYA